MKVALVTGASKGLGLEWSRHLAKEGYQVILTARNLEKAQDATNKLKDEGYSFIYPQKLDTTNTSQILELKDWLSKTFGKMDLLINNAGINSGTRAKGDKTLQQKNLLLENLDTDEVLNMLNVNAIAPIIVARGFRDLLSKGIDPKIINIGSWLGSISLKNNGGNYSYAVSKSALNMMNRALAFDLIESGIISVVVNPGWVQTNMGGERAQFTTEEAVSNIYKNVVQDITIDNTGSFFNYNGFLHPW